MSRSFGLVDYKVQEAEYFLLLMTSRGKKTDFYGVQFCASAFVSAARSITFAMQSSLKGVPEFEAWYPAKQVELRRDPLARFFHDFRTVTQHIGDNVVSGGRHDKYGTKYFFVPCADLPSVPDMDVLSACEAYFVSILELVFACYIDLGPIVDGQQRFTESHFETLGMSIEDAEEELGFPRGWTDIGDPGAMPWRWELIRKQADGCQIQEQFERWLNKVVPRLETLAPYSRAQPITPPHQPQKV